MKNALEEISYSVERTKFLIVSHNIDYKERKDVIKSSYKLLKNIINPNIITDISHNKIYNFLHETKNTESKKALNTEYESLNIFKHSSLILEQYITKLKRYSYKLKVKQIKICFTSLSKNNPILNLIQSSLDASNIITKYLLNDYIPPQDLPEAARSIYNYSKNFDFRKLTKNDKNKMIN